MFRAAQVNPFDEAVGKATDENLTSENWALILDVCDKVGAEDTGGRDAAAAMIKRLAHRNANVQLYTLELANALSQNCGPKINKELASRSFTDALLRLAGDRNTHTQVKAKILERVAEWAEMFSKDPDLGIMEQAYMRLKSQNPNLQPPSKPYKQEITDMDRQKEDDELQMALALSVKDKNSSSSVAPEGESTAAGATQTQPTQQSMPTGTTAATVSRVRALYDFQPSEPGELQFFRGDIVAVLESVYKDWWKGSLRGQTGIFPLNYVEKLQDPTQDELHREAQMEAEVFGEIKNVEKLLALLSTSSNDVNARDNDEITSLYHSTLAIRPKLIELIGKYSQKKDDFTQLNEKFIKARRDYEALLETSMSHPPPNQYGRPHPQQQQQQQQPYGYGAPPPQSEPYGQQQGYGYPPPQQMSPPPPQDPQYPPRNGPAPFYMLPPNQQQAAQQQHPPEHAPQVNTQPGGYPPARQASTTSRHSVQELATSAYDSPAASRPVSDYNTGIVPQHSGNPYPAPLQPGGGFNAQQQQQPPPQPQHQPPAQPAYAPPGAPTSPIGQPPPQHYQPYQAQPPAATGGGDDASDYYR